MAAEGNTLFVKLVLRRLEGGMVTLLRDHAPADG
jgi:hypothetical protein